MMQRTTEREAAAYEDYLADVLCVWDCYEQKWLEDAPVILRFENRDVVMAQSKLSGYIAQGFGDDETERLILTELNDSNNAYETCFCWLSPQSASASIGSVCKPTDFAEFHLGG